ncbi:hypothetical protein [Roseiarcus sp.]|uniref:hypothetical protein n=1 Tax=Roseiarcus sp. TaxID=1969460 RepID=UPI003F9C3ABC
MSPTTNAENRALNAAELEMVNATLPDAIERPTTEELKALAHRLRQAHSRANDISIRQQREIRGKAEPHAAVRAKDAAGSIAKTQTLMEAIQRINGELARREEIETGRPSPAEFARRALELKMAADAGHHPDAGQTAKTGMRPKKRTEEFTGGTSKREMGRVSQAGRVAQAHKDSGKS